MSIDLKPAQGSPGWEVLKDKCRAAVERNGVEGDAEDADNLYDEVYTSGFDALHDLGVDDWTAGEVAAELARDMAQP
jgi:hypothetical protein